LRGECHTSRVTTRYEMNAQKLTGSQI